MTTEPNRALVATETTTEPETEELSMVPVSTAQRRPDNLSRDLLYPRDSLNPDVDIQLFGSYIDSIGLDKDEIQTSDIQYRFVIKMFDALGDAIEEGRLEEIRPTLRYFMQDIGNRLIAVLARGIQYYEEKEMSEKEKRPLWRVIAEIKTPEEKRYRDISQDLCDISEAIEAKRDELRDKLTSVILQEEELDMSVKVQTQIAKLDNLLNEGRKFITHLQNGHTNYEKHISTLYQRICGQIVSIANLGQKNPNSEFSTDLEQNIIDIFAPKSISEPLDQKIQQIMSQAGYTKNFSKDSKELGELSAIIEALSNNSSTLIDSINRQTNRYMREKLGDILSNGDSQNR